MGVGGPSGGEQAGGGFGAATACNDCRTDGEENWRQQQLIERPSSSLLYFFFFFFFIAGVVAGVPMEGMYVPLPPFPCLDRTLASKFVMRI
jgi:hypothetical protein